MLSHHDDTIFPNVNSSITYNDRSSLLLNGILCMSYTKKKKKAIIFHGLG
jgi:hypothetical protein